MQFAPEELRRFRLVYETYSARLFEVGAPYDGYRATAYHPLFDRDRFPGIPPEGELLAFYDDVGRAASRYFEGAALQRLGRYDAAAAAFNDALQWHPDYEDADFRLGMCLIYLGRETEGRRELERAVAAHPGDATARAWLAAVPGRRLPPPAAGK
jgi:tetratricopeptide (TPR) repeat protein